METHADIEFLVIANGPVSVKLPWDGAPKKYLIRSIDTIPTPSPTTIARPVFYTREQIFDANGDKVSNVLSEGEFNELKELFIETVYRAQFMLPTTERDLDRFGQGANIHLSDFIIRINDAMKKYQPDAFER